MCDGPLCLTSRRWNGRSLLPLQPLLFFVPPSLPNDEDTGTESHVAPGPYLDEALPYRSDSLSWVDVPSSLVLRCDPVLTFLNSSMLFHEPVPHAMALRMGGLRPTAPKEP